jgi:hypothetical protein
MLIGLTECALYKCAVIISLAKFELNLYVSICAVVRARFSPRSAPPHNPLWWREKLKAQAHLLIIAIDDWLFITAVRSICSLGFSKASLRMDFYTSLGQKGGFQIACINTRTVNYTSCKAAFISSDRIFIHNSGIVSNSTNSVDIMTAI